MNRKNAPRGFQAGSSLLEVLVALLLLSFGMLAMGIMFSFSVQMPKMSGYRAAATNMAANHIERIRANPGGFLHNDYQLPLTYDGTSTALALTDCSYPACTEATLATMDNGSVTSVARAMLPAGGVLVTCDTTPCSSTSYGNIWIMWQEPSTRAVLDPSTSDNCPDQVVNSFTSPRPRCLYVRFRG